MKKWKKKKRIKAIIERKREKKGLKNGKMNNLITPKRSYKHRSTKKNQVYLYL